jgi:hypothetical protein
MRSPRSLFVSSLPFLNQWTDFYEMWYEHYFLQSAIITTWRSHELVRWEVTLATLNLEC